MDEIKSQLPVIRTKYTKYSEFATHTFSDVFPEQLVASAVERKAQMLQSVCLLNNSEGKYTIAELPATAQYAPIHAFLTDDFNGDGQKDILAAGNFHGNTPSIGKFDASYGVYLTNDGNGRFTSVEPAESGFAVYGEARDMKLIRKRGIKNGSSSAGIMCR